MVSQTSCILDTACIHVVAMLLQIPDVLVAMGKANRCKITQHADSACMHISCQLASYVVITDYIGLYHLITEGFWLVGNVDYILCILTSV